MHIGPMLITIDSYIIMEHYLIFIRIFIYSLINTLLQTIY